MAGTDRVVKDALRSPQEAPPTDLPTEASLGLVGDAHPFAPRVFAESRDPCCERRFPSLGAGVGGELGLGEGPDNHDLLTIGGHRGRPLEPLRRDPAGEPTSELFHTHPPLPCESTITALHRQDGQEAGPLGTRGR